MQFIDFSYVDSCLVGRDEIEKIGAKLQPEVERVRAAIALADYSTAYASVNLSADQQLRANIKKIVEEKKKLNPTMLIVIGIGGSNLGTIAVHEALFGKFYNEQLPDIKVYFADTVDSDYLYDIILLVEQELEAGNAVLINIISKSGATTETIANFEVIYHLFRCAYGHLYSNYIVITTDKDSKLWGFAQEEKITCLEIPDNVGGRYSVLSAVGLFPMALLGIDIEELHRGAHYALASCTSENILDNPAAISATLLAIYGTKGYNIHDTFLFSVDLCKLGAWYRQLMAESIGKQHDVHGAQIFAGITPTVSVGSTDLHSVGQLYLGGPYDKFTTFVTVKKNKSNVVVPNYKSFERLVAKIQDKPLSSIMDAILCGVQTAYTKNNRPFVLVGIPEKTAYYMGQFLQLKMLEIMYLGFLLEVNPFDQPNVQLYKKETRELL